MDVAPGHPLIDFLKWSLRWRSPPDLILNMPWIIQFSWIYNLQKIPGSQNSKKYPYMHIIILKKFTNKVEYSMNYE